jgi:integrase
MINSQKTYPHKLARLIRPINGKGRWYIEFYIWDLRTEKLVRKRSYLGFEKFASDQAKALYGKNKCKEINKVLRFTALDNQEFRLKEERPKLPEKLSLSEAFSRIITIKYPIDRNRKTHLTYTSICARFTEFCAKNLIIANDIKKVNQKIAQEYIDYLTSEKKLHQNTVVANHSALRTIFNGLLKRNIIESNPWIGIDKPGEIQTERNIAFTTLEQQKLKEIISGAHPELWNIVQLIYYCFLRPVEISRLKRKDFDFEKGKIFVSGQNSKNGKDSFLVIPDALLQHYLNQGFDKLNGELFLFGADGKASLKPIGNNWMNRKHSQFLDKLNITGKTLYSWKHTGVVAAYNAGVDLKSIQLQCRHHSIEQTDIYLKSLGFQENTAFKNGMPSL